MAFNWKRKRFDNLVILFNNKFSSMSKNSCNNILAFKPSPDEIWKAISFNSSMRVNLSDKEDSSSRNRKFETAIGVNVFIETELFGQMPKSLPETIPEYSWKLCAMFLAGKPPVGFLIMVIMHKSPAGSPERVYCRAFMPLVCSFLPEGIEALDKGVSSRFSLRNEYQMYPHKQMKPDNLGYTVLISSSTGSGHLIIHLGDLRNSHISPCFNQMLTQSCIAL